MNKSKIEKTLSGSVFAKSAITLLAVMFVLGLAACPDGGVESISGNGKDAALTAVKFDGTEATLGTPAAAYAGITAPGSITLLSGSNVTVVAKAKDSKAEIQYAKVTGDEDPDFFYDNEYTFAAAGDALAIEVTAADRKTKSYYRINVTVADVALESLTIGGKNVTLPIAALTWQDAIAGAVLFDYPVDDQPAGGLAVTATAASDGAAVEYGHAVGTAAPAFNSTSSITFTNGEFLYIKVSKDESDAYYKIAVNFQMKGTIKYGSPEITDNVIDSLWDDPDLDIYPIIKPYPRDCSADFLANPHTFGEAKALWDEQGLYLYVKITDPEVSELGGSSSTAHEVDSVELFINEAYPSTSYTAGGSQYRVGANGERSGEGDSPAALEALDRTSAWKTDDGYIVIFQAPWRLRGKFPITDGREIGFEIQINAAPETGQRYGVMVWNNVAHTNYQDARDYGVATLDAVGRTLNFPAVPPTIDTQPQGAIVSGGESVTLTVAASVLPANGGNLSYQWYSAETSGADGTAITGAASASYTFTAPATAGAYYYYVVVTNTLNGTTATTRSAAAKVTVSEVVMIEQLTLSENFAIYQFSLPADEEFGNYTSITVDYWMDEDNFDKGVRSIRLMGNYLSTDFTPHAATGHMVAAFDSYNAPYIYDDIGAGAIAAAGGEANQWFTLTYRLVDNNPNSGFAADNRPEAAAAGPFFFGVGVPAWGNADDPTAAKTQLVRNITMVHKDTPSKNAAGTSTEMFAGYGDHRQAHTSREWVPDPGSGALATAPEEWVLPLPYTPFRNPEAQSTWGAGVVLPIPDDWDIRTEYTRFTITMKCFDADDEEFTPDWGSAQLKFHATVVSDANGTAITTVYNAGRTGVQTADIPADVLNYADGPIMAVSVQPSNGNNNPDIVPAFIEIVEFKFHN